MKIKNKFVIMSSLKVTHHQIISCKTAKDLLDNIPIKCVCEDLQAFNELKKRFKEAGVTFQENANTFEINS